MLEVEVCGIRGKCLVRKVGDRIIVDGPKIVLERTDAIRVHALSTLLHYAAALEEGADPVKFGLTPLKDKTFAYMQCVYPEKSYTDDGRVIFRCKRGHVLEVGSNVLAGAEPIRGL